MRATKTLATLNSTLILDIGEDTYGGGTVQYGDGGAGTIVVEGKVTDADDWDIIGLTPLAGGAIVASVAAAGSWTFPIMGLNYLRVRVSVAGAGVNVSLGYGRSC